MSSIGLISFLMDVGNEGSREVFAKDEKTNKELGRVACYLSEFPGPNDSFQSRVFIRFDKSEFPNVTNSSDITLWQKPLDSKEEQRILAARIHDLVIDLEAF